MLDVCVNIVPFIYIYRVGRSWPGQRRIHCESHSKTNLLGLSNSHDNISNYVIIVTHLTLLFQLIQVMT